MLRALITGAALVWTTMACSHHHHHKKDHANHRFDDPKEWTERFDDPSRDEWQKPGEVIAALQLPQGAKVADLGSATGYFTTRIARAHPDAVVYGADVEAGMTAHLEERAKKEGLGNVRALTTPPDELKLPEPVDVLLLVNTYHHIAKRPEYFARVANTWLRPGARLAIVDFTKNAEMGPPSDEKLTPEEVIAELNSAGFKLVQTHGLLPNQYFLLFASSGGR